MRICITQTNMQLKSLDANFNLRRYSVFPSTGNVDDKGDRDHCEKGGEFSTPTVNPPGSLHEPRGTARNDMLVKQGHETQTDVIVALSIHERQPCDPTEDYGPRCPIMEETHDFHAGDATP